MKPRPEEERGLDAAALRGLRFTLRVGMRWLFDITILTLHRFDRLCLFPSFGLFALMGGRRFKPLSMVLCRLAFLIGPHLRSGSWLALNPW